MARSIRRPGRGLTVGLVNNMPDGALAATERQFRRLLQPEDEDSVSLRLFHIPTVPRSPAGTALLQERSEPLEALFDSEVDALVVTGTEPVHCDLTREPYWDDLARLVDWAAARTVSTIWSCLAAHAAVLRLDGIERRPATHKVFGVETCRVVASHPLTGRPGARTLVPHSRQNGLDTDELRRAGYDLLTMTEESGVDMFARSVPSLFVFLQGHPEYEADSLGREYRRDMGRFISGERSAPPRYPRNYYPAAAEARLAALLQRPGEADPDGWDALARELPGRAPWAADAARLYANWLELVAARRDDLAAAPATPKAPRAKPSRQHLPAAVAPAAAPRGARAGSRGA